MKSLRVVWFTTIVLLIALPTGAALASSGGNPLDRIITGDDYVLDSGETEDGDVVVLGGSVEIRNGATLDGDLAVLGGDVELAGNVTGDVVVLGGDVDILKNAHIEGDCALFGGNLSTAEGAQIDGEMLTDLGRRWFFFDRDDADGGRLPEVPSTPERPVIPEIPAVPERPTVVYRHGTSFAERIGVAFLSAIAVGIVTLLITLFLPRHTDQVRQVVVREPVVSGLVGFLTFLAVVLLTPILALISLILVLVCIGILGFPLIALMWLALVAAYFLGWAAIGQLTGRWLCSRLHLQGMMPALQAGFGAFTLSFVLGLVQAIGCIVGFVGGLLGFAAFCIAAGAVVLTRFGLQDYQGGEPILSRRRSLPSPPAPPEAPPAPEPVAPEEEESTGDDTPLGKSGKSGPAEPLLDSEGPFPER